MKNITYFMCLLIFSCFAFVACQDDHGDSIPSGKDGVIRVAFEIPDFVEVGTRDVTSESGIKDVTVLQFKDGKFVKQLFLEDKVFSLAVELEGLEPMAAAIVNEDPESGDYGKLIQNGSENVLVFLANVKAMTGAPVSYFTVGTSTYADLLNYTATFEDANALGGLQYMPMAGTYLGGITDGVTNLINVTLTRALAKINFTLNTDNFMTPNGERPSINVNSISLHNVPAAVTFFPSNRPALPANGLPGEWSDAQAPYPVATAGSNPAANDGGTDAENFVTLDVTHNQSATGKSTSFVGYMPENARGSYSNIANNKQKIPAAITDAANRVGLTYLLVDLDYANAAGVIKNVTYRIYIGGDAAGDMNLLANTQYNVTTYVYGDGTGGDTDTRIEVKTLFDSTPSAPSEINLQSSANSYIIDATKVPNNFTIPLIQARDGWRYIQSIRGAIDNADYVAAFDDMVKGEDWRIVTLWRTWNDSNKNITGSKSAQVSTPGGSANDFFAQLIFPLDISNGHNAVIALQDFDGKIWWTWHLWFTDYNPDADGSQMNGQTHKYFSDAFGPSGLYNGKKMMDRSLGATITNVNDETGIPLGGDYVADSKQPATTTEAVKWYGLMYQWGRKDPFTNSDDGTSTITNAVPVYDAEGNPYNYGSGVQVGVDMNGNSILAGANSNSTDGFPKVAAGANVYRVIDAIRNPMVYFHSGVSNDWTAQDNDLWTMYTKSPFDPCPYGWRVPAGGGTAANNPWAGFGAGSASDTGNNTAYATSFGTDGPFPWHVAVNGGTGTAGRLYGANNTAITGIGAPWYDNGNNTAWYPASGFRNPASGVFNYVGTLGYAWSCAITSVNVYFLDFSSTGVNPILNNGRAYGFPVRCVQN